jgi:hypothetical protein
LPRRSGSTSLLSKRWQAVDAPRTGYVRRSPYRSGADANAENLACTDVEVEASSGSDITLRATGSLKAEASSGASITVKGKPTKTDIDEDSGGSIELED